MLLICNKWNSLSWWWGLLEHQRGRETETGERRELINNSICCPAWGSISSVSGCQCVWGGEAGAAACTVLFLTACRTINGHNLISHYRHQWLLACRAQHNSIRQTGVWGWGELLKFKVILGFVKAVKSRSKTQLTTAEGRRLVTAKASGS